MSHLKETPDRPSRRPRLFGMLDNYLIGNFLKTFFFIILGLALISCVIDLSEKVGDFIQKHAPVGAVFGYYGAFIPHITALLFPLFIFIAVIFFTSRLAYKSEIIAMLATGMSFPRFLRPYLISGCLLAGIFLFLNHIVIPNANKRRLWFEDHYYHNAKRASDQDVHLQLSADLQVRMHSYDYGANRGSQFGADRMNGTLILERLFAESASYDSVKRIWTLSNVTIRSIDSLKDPMQYHLQLIRQYSFTPDDLRKDNDNHTALTTPELNRYIARERVRGNANLNVLYLEKHRRTANPFAAIILTVIGAVIASRKVRGGSGLHIFLGVLLSAVYMLALQLTNTLSTNAGFSPMLAVWMPNIIFGTFALVLVWWQSR